MLSMKCISGVGVCVCVVQMSHLTGAYGVIRWEGESNDNVYNRWDLAICVEYGVTERVKHNTLKWSGYTETRKNVESQMSLSLEPHES